jgi:hypothetical protein
MIGDDERYSVERVHLTTQLSNRELCLKQSLRGERAKGKNDFGPEHVELPHQEWAARRDLVRRWIAIARRPVFEHVANEDVFAFELDRFEDFREELPGLADEWASGVIFGRTGRLADANQARVRTSLTRHGVLGGRMKCARRAGFDQRRDFVERFHMHQRAAE